MKRYETINRIFFSFCLFVCFILGFIFSKTKIATLHTARNLWAFSRHNEILDLYYKGTIVWIFPSVFIFYTLLNLSKILLLWIEIDPWLNEINLEMAIDTMLISRISSLTNQSQVNSMWLKANWPIASTLDRIHLSSLSLLFHHICSALLTY